MADFFEIDFLAVETDKSGDAIPLRYSIDGAQSVHVVDGGFVDTGTTIVEHILKYYDSNYVDHVVLTHSDSDHANGLRTVLETLNVGTLWMNRPWLYAEELLPRFPTYHSADALRRTLRQAYPGPAALEDIANEKGISIAPAFQGQRIGAFTILAPSRTRYLNLIVESDKTPQAKAVLDGGLARLWEVAKDATRRIKALWGEEYFPPAPTSRENEMSIVQYAFLNNRKILLTGDAGREALQEAIEFAPHAGLYLPGVDNFQVPHHGGRHNVSTELLDKLLGERLPSLPNPTLFNAVCSSAKKDEAHPRDSVKRAMMHRGAHFAATEGRHLCWSVGVNREGWSPVPQTDYPQEQED